MAWERPPSIVAFQQGAYTSLSVREGKASALSFAGCRARLRAILAQTSAARIGRGSLIGLRRRDLLPLRAFRNDDEDRLPVAGAEVYALNASTARVPAGIASMCSVLVRPCVASIVSAHRR